MTAMTSLGQTAVPDAAAPRLDDDMANLRELARALAEAPVSQVTDAGPTGPAREGATAGTAAASAGRTPTSAGVFCQQDSSRNRIWI